MAQKNFRVYFFVLSALGDDGESGEVDYLWQLLTDPALYEGGVSRVEATNRSTDKTCELREVVQVGDVIKGCLALLRDELPPIRRANRSEAPLPVDDGDRILEKNYFLYFRRTRLLAWQFNLSANHIANMALMLTALGGMTRTVSYTHKLKSVFALTPGQIIEYVDLKIAEPRRRSQRAELEQLDPTRWGINPFKILADSHARQLEVVMQNKTQDGLIGSLGQMVTDLTGTSMTRKLKVRVEGAAEPVDMLAERYTYKIPMQCAGPTPSATETLQALQQAKDRYDAEQAQANLG